MVDGVHLGRASDDAAVGRHEPNRPRSVHRHAFAGSDIGKLGAVVAGREDVGQHGEVGLVLGPRRKRQAVEVREGHLKVLGLAADPRPHGHVSVSATGEPRVYSCAEPREPAQAVLAEATGDVEGQHHPVAHLALLDGRANLLDDAHVLVTEHDPGLGGGPTLVHVEV